MKKEHREYILSNMRKETAGEISKKLGLKERKIKKILDEQKNRRDAGGLQAVAAPELKSKHVFLSSLLIVALGFAVYANSLNGRFVWDDESLIQNNVQIRSWRNIGEVFTRNITVEAGRQWSFYRPLQISTYMADYALWGTDVRGYHLTNTLLHVLASLTVFWLVNILFGDWLLSLLTGVLFVVHPVHTEAVAYISGRADSLVLLFTLLSFVFYIKSSDLKAKIYYPLVWMCYLLAVFSKESSLILPVLLLLYHFSFKKKLSIKRFLPIAGITFIYIFMKVAVFAKSAAVLHQSSLFQRLPGFFAAVASYARLFFFPFHLHMEYGYKLFRYTDPAAVLGSIILSFLLLCVFYQRQRSSLIFFSLAWVLITILPVSNLYPINAYMAEHWLYLPSIGFFIIAAGGLSFIFKAKNLRIFSVFLSVFLVGFYSYLTIKQNGYWADPATFYETTLKYGPEPRIYNNLANVYAAADRKEEAVTLYQKAIKIDPNYAEAYYNLGVIRKDTGKNEEAIMALEKAVKINPSHAEAYNNLGIVYGFSGKPNESILAYKKAIEINPDHAAAYNNLGVVYRDSGKNEESIVLFKKALEIDPGYTTAHNNIGNAYRAAGKTKEAVTSYERAIASNPNYDDAYCNLGIVYDNAGETEEAISAYKKAIKVNPNSTKAYNNLSAIYFRKKQYGLAIQYSDKAKEFGFTNTALLEALEPFRSTSK